jgi:hypothetical protein
MGYLKLQYLFKTLCLNIATCQSSGTLQLHEHGCVINDTHNIVDLTTSNREDHL